MPYHADVIGNYQSKWIASGGYEYTADKVFTQCGFSPVSIGANLISEDTQQRKLELVAEVAHRVW